MYKYKGKIQTKGSYLLVNTQKDASEAFTELL